MILYQMPLSHFCEKIRWALAYKRLPYKEKNLLPGVHAKVTKKLSGQTSVPVLKDGKHIIAHSAEIISFLDREYPRFPLTPDDHHDREHALEIEAWADKDIGPAVRLLVYSVLIQHDDIFVLRA